MLPNTIDDLAPARVARITGGFYVAYILASVLATMLGQIGMADAPQVYQAIVTNEGSFRLALAVALISGLLFLMVAWGLYVLLRPVNRNLALLFLLLNAVGVATQGASLMWLLSALLQGGPASHMQAFRRDSWRGWRTCRSTSTRLASSRPSCSSAPGCSRSGTSSTGPGTFPGSWASC